MNKIAIFAVDNFEDIELITPIDVFTREEIPFELFSADNKTTITGKFGATLKSKPITEFKSEEFSGLLLPGGTLDLSKKEKVNKTVKEFYKEEKDLYAICAAPIILWNNKILDDENFTCWPGLELSKSKDTDVEISNNIITAKDYKSSLKWTDAIIKQIKNR